MKSLFLIYRVTQPKNTPAIFQQIGPNQQKTETANRAESGQLQFWSKPSEILNLRSSNIPETVAFTIP